MKPTRFCFLFLLAIFPAFATGQNESAEFISGSARFALTVNGAAPVLSASHGRIEDYILPTETFTWRESELAVIVMHIAPYSVRPSSFFRMPPASRSVLLAMVERQFAESAKKENKISQRAPFVRQNAKGVELLVSGKHRSVVRIFFINDRLYVLVAHKPDQEGFDSQEKILDTFRFLSENEYIETMLREHTPAELPQDVPTGILPTDAMEKNLKGGVMEIVEDAEHTGPPVKRSRNLIETFARNGFITKQVTFAGGLPDVVTTFGWVDGNRAANVGPISHFPERWRGPGAPRTVVGHGAPEGENFIGRDLAGNIVDRRYTTRFEVKYDDEWRVSERRHLTSSGDVSLTEKYRYTSAGRDIKTEDDRGGFISRHLEILDSNGAATEEFQLDNRGGRVGRKVFKYQFDAKGNWIVKKEFTQQIGRARALKHTATYYRSIKYYDQ